VAQKLAYYCVVLYWHKNGIFQCFPWRDGIVLQGAQLGSISFHGVTTFDLRRLVFFFGNREIMEIGQKV